MEKMKILIVDDHSLIRSGIKTAIAEEKTYSVFEASSVAEALSLVDKKNPDALVLDISLPDANGMDLAENLLNDDPNIRIIILSMYKDYEYISRCLEIGVNGYVLKNEGDEIVQALKEVFDGRNYYSTGVKDLIVNQYAQKIQNKTVTPMNITLTNREKEVIRFVIDGYTSNEIADKLFISTKTVNTHRSNIMKKFDVKNSIGLVKKVKELKILD